MSSKLYNTPGWTRLRKRQLAREPLCRMCLARGIVNDGKLRRDGSYQEDPRRHFLVADHIVPHRDDPVAFYNGALQTLCPDDHDITKQREESRGYSNARGADGWPTDPRHPANRPPRG